MFHSRYSVSLCCSVYCLCVNVYCTAATGCQTNCSHQIYHISYHIVSYISSIDSNRTNSDPGHISLQAQIICEKRLKDSGHAVVQLVEALRYKAEGRWFDSRWCHRFFSST